MKAASKRRGNQKTTDSPRHLRQMTNVDRKKWISGFIYHRDNYITVLLASIFRRLTSVGIAQDTIGPPLSIAPLSFGTACIVRR